MSGYTTSEIRNIALAGGAGAGKTSLAEALLREAGAINQKGSVLKGTTASDFLPLERAQQHSVASTVLHFENAGIHFNLLDTPGSPDLLGRTLAVLPAVEAVAVVVHAADGPDIVARRTMAWAGERGLDRLLVVNQIDAPGADPQRCLDAIRDAFGRECLPLNLPAGGGARVVDCFFEHTGEPTDFSSVALEHTRLIDQIVELDEALMARYLEQGDHLEPRQLHDAFERALREGHLLPVCFVSAQTDAGVAELLQVLARLLPNPTESNPPLFLKGEGAAAVPVTFNPIADGHVLAHVFKIIVDPFVGRLALFRVHQGRITRDSQLFIGSGRKPFRVAHLLQPHGKEQVEVSEAIAGDICAVAKVDDINFNDVLHDSHDEDHIQVPEPHLPAPMHGVSVQARARGDEQKISDVLAKLQAEDPSMRIEHDHALNETVMRALGELHLRVLLHDLRERFHVEVDTRPPKIAYRETISQPAEGHYRHKKQTGGAGQFGEVFLRIRPLSRGEGIAFVDAVVGGAIPRQFLPAVEKGVRQVIAEGVVAGYQMQDIEVTVFDGKYHPVDSKEVAFVTAAKRAFIDAVQQAHPVILEPMVQVSITAPSGNTGSIAGDLSGKRGQVQGTTALPGNMTEISALVPLAELDGYQSQLKSITGGAGSFAHEFSHYDPVPPRVQENLRAAHRPRPED
ncbi:MAG: elongation factor G [Gammaproteobacteria bacterium]|nr:elongation factor G [Gammaproteobacteria bacterium]